MDAWAGELGKGSEMTAFASLTQTLPLWSSEETKPSYISRTPEINLLCKPLSLAFVTVALVN